ncbi:hypothetical protein M758_8G002500 [Ceratodon purpureus]|nr:hypothetical protein M758_8G002500 [Ceratodon purpureus]
MELRTVTPVYQRDFGVVTIMVFGWLIRAMATPSVDRVRSTIRALQWNTQDLLQDFDRTVLYAKLVAEDLEKYNDSDSVHELQDATLDILTASHNLRNHSKALDSISASYQPSSEVTNFEQLLRDRVREVEEESPFDPETHELLKEFKEAVWEVHHAGEPMPGQEEEEIVVTGASQAIPNTACALSGKPVDQLENPVRSRACRHIYERDAVIDYVRKHEAETQMTRRHRPHPCRCAAAGCPGILVEDQLMCDRSLKIQIQEYMLRQQSSNVDVVADCTHIDEDDVTPLKASGSRRRS